MIKEKSLKERKFLIKKDIENIIQNISVEPLFDKDSFFDKCFNKKKLKEKKLKAYNYAFFMSNYIELMSYYYFQGNNIINIDYPNIIYHEIIKNKQSIYFKDNIIDFKSIFEDKNIEIDTNSIFQKEEGDLKEDYRCLMFTVSRQISCINRAFFINLPIDSRIEFYKAKEVLFLLAEETIKLVDFMTDFTLEEILKNYKDFYEKEEVYINSKEKKLGKRKIDPIIINGYFNFYNINRMLFILEKELEKSKKDPCRGLPN